MQDKTSYHYDFSYSLALDPILQPDSPSSPSSPSQTQSLEHQFSQWLSIFSQTKPIRQSTNTSLNRSLSLIYRVPAYKKLGHILVKLCAILHNVINVQERQSQIEKLRENVYMLWKQLCDVMGEEKDKYASVVALGFFAIVYRVLASQCYLEDQFAVFHTVYWQLRGQLTNKQTMQMLISKIFNVDLFHKFMFWDQQQLKETFCAQKKMEDKKDKNVSNQILTFRASLALQQSKGNNNRSNQMYQSFKDIQDKFKNKGESKENMNSNFNSFSPATTFGALQSSKINFDNFRKKPNPISFQQSKPLKNQAPNPHNFTSVPTQALTKKQPQNPTLVHPQQNPYTARFQDMKSKNSQHNQYNTGVLSFRENRELSQNKIERGDKDIRRELFRKV